MMETHIKEKGANLGRAIADNDTSLLQSGDLVLSSTYTRDEGELISDGSGGQ